MAPICSCRTATCPLDLSRRRPNGGIAAGPQVRDHHGISVARPATLPRARFSAACRNTVRDLVGHSSVAMSLRHAPLAPDQRREVVARTADTEIVTKSASPTKTAGCPSADQQADFQDWHKGCNGCTGSAPHTPERQHLLSGGLELGRCSRLETPSALADLCCTHIRRRSDSGKGPFAALPLAPAPSLVTSEPLYPAPADRQVPPCADP